MELSLVRGIVPRTVFGLTAIAAIILVIGLALSKSNKRGRLHRSLVCECEAVTAGEVQYAVENLNVNSLLDLRRRTRVGMGTCQDRKSVV